MLLVTSCWATCDGLASHPGRGSCSNAPSRFMLQKPKLSTGNDKPFESFNRWARENVSARKTLAKASWSSFTDKPQAGVNLVD